jgi:hypothetical protein
MVDKLVPFSVPHQARDAMKQLGLAYTPPGVPDAICFEMGSRLRTVKDPPCRGSLPPSAYTQAVLKVMKKSKRG